MKDSDLKKAFDAVTISPQQSAEILSEIRSSGKKKRKQSRLLIPVCAAFLLGMILIPKNNTDNEAIPETAEMTSASDMAASEEEYSDETGTDLHTAESAYGDTARIDGWPAEDEILFSSKGSESLLVSFMTAEEAINTSDAIIYGEFSDYETGAENGSVYTAVKIHVIDSIFGDIEAGTDITLIENGGWVLIREYIDSFDHKETGQAVRNNLFRNRTDEEINTKYFEMIPEYYDYPKTGKHEVLLLRRHRQKDNCYLRACGSGSVYQERENGMFWSAGNQISYEELKELLLNARN